MLDAIRRRAGSWVVKLLFVLLVLSFGVWGIADVLSPGSGARWAAEVGDIHISREAYQQEYQETLNRFGQQFGSRLDADQARALGLPNGVLTQMINAALVDQAASDLGVVVSDDTVRDAIRSNPGFRNNQGQFDTEVFRAVLQRNGFSEDRYVSLLRQEMARDQLLSSFTAGVAAPKALVEEIERYRGERRIAEYVIIPPDPAEDLALPDDATLRQFYQDFPGLFSTPELRTVSAIVLSVRDLAGMQSVSEADLQAAYQERISEFTRPERRSLRQKIFDDEATARRARVRLNQGAPLKAVALEFDPAAGEPEQIGPVTRGQVPVELADEVFRLAPGQASEPIKTPYGWHIVEVLSVDPGSVDSFEQARERLNTALREEKAADAIIDVGNRLEDALGRGATLEEAAGELGLALRSIAAIDASGRDADGKPIPDLPSRFAEIAFETAQGRDSTLIESGAGDYFVLRVDQVMPSAVKPFEAVRDAAERAWRQREIADRSKRRAEGLAEKLRAGTPLATIAAEQALKLATTPPLTRTGEGAPEAVPPPAVTALFGAKTGEVITVPTAERFIVARLTSVLPVTATGTTSETNELRSELGEALRSDVFNQFAAALRSRYPVRINQSVLDEAL